jgi:hypothetical protein
MKKQLLQIALGLALIFSCTNSKRNQMSETLKMHPNDPFKSTMVESQFFDIKANQDNVVEGNRGTILIVPKGCFKDENDNIVESDVKIELTESLSMEDIILSNLNTTSNGKPLETDGMIYFNATLNGKQLTINKENPIHIEMPTNKKKPDMMVYQGSRDEKGNMNWTEPQAINNYLTTVDINALDFLPEGFQAEVERNMPYKNYKIATQNLVDSLYYTFGTTITNLDLRILRNHQVGKQYNEAFYNKNRKVENGEYTSESYENIHSNDSAVKLDTSKSECGIDPAIIKVIKSEKYQNTLIATREFETRLKVIFKTCKKAILEIYINNLDKNLYELDEMALRTLGENEHSKDFKRFASQRLTKVKNADKYAQLLRGYYQTQLAKVKSELEENQEKLRISLQKQQKEAEKLVEKYKKLLFKREKYRMETYGFEWSKTGWINVDIGTEPKDWEMQPLEVVVHNGKDFDRVYTYVIYSSIKSLYRLNSDDNYQFYVGNNQDKKMIMPKNETAVVISIGYKGENPSLTIKEFQTGTNPKMSLTIKASTTEKVKTTLSQYEKYSKENRISEDLKYMAAFYKEEQRQKGLHAEHLFLARLITYAEPCCSLIMPKMEK